ncbi:MAG: MoxR family ATPase [bacterium]
MNINQAKINIKNSITAYLAKDDIGQQIIKTHQQRPVFLMGPPGIGKTDIMKQIAEELNVALVSYSMTHHTRQSALGLPFIVDKTYNNETYKVSEYTMSEILSTVYDLIEETNMKEGILFLDEINCVSETLAPSMLQFLQYKTFGRHKVPDGWIVVTAGNPPEYNNSVREFDLVTWDRLKRIDVEPDFPTWRKFAFNTGVHPAIISYLETKVADFYSISATVDGVEFVTARGWCDLSKVMCIYETLGYPIDFELVSQYIQNKKIANNFAIYLDLFKKYKDDYHVSDIIEGTHSNDVAIRAQKAPFDERILLSVLLYEKILEKVTSIRMNFDHLTLLTNQIKFMRSISVEQLITNLDDEIKKQNSSGTATNETISTYKRVIASLKSIDTSKDSMAQARDIYSKIKNTIETDSKACSNNISHAFKFIEDNVTDKNIMSVWITNLTSNDKIVYFLSQNTCEYYHKHSTGLLVLNQEEKLLKSIAQLDEEIK